MNSWPPCRCTFKVHRLDLLRFPGRDGREQQHDDARDQQAHGLARARIGDEEEADQHRDDDADRGHGQEPAPAGHVLLGRVADEARRREGGSRDDERLSDEAGVAPGHEHVDHGSNHGAPHGGVEPECAMGDDCAAPSRTACARRSRGPARQRTAPTSWGRWQSRP